MDRDEALRQVDAAKDELAALRGSTRNAELHLHAMVKQAFTDAGVSQTELAERLQMHRNSVVKWCA